MRTGNKEYTPKTDTCRELAFTHRYRLPKIHRFGRLIVVCIYPLSYTCGNPSRKRHMSSKESRFTVNNRLFITWIKHRFGNRVTRRVLSSVIFFTVTCYSKWNHVLCSPFAVTGIVVMTKPQTTVSKLLQEVTLFELDVWRGNTTLRSWWLTLEAKDRIH